MSRAYHLDDLIQPHDYTPGKNSFLFQAFHAAQKKTVLDLTGSGSVRHFWSTWSVPGSDSVPGDRVLLRVFVDKQPTPSIVGTIDQICRAAEATGTRYVPLPAFNYKDAYNFYLPIYFTNGIRIEVEALTDLDEFYTQIDYRLDPEHKQTTRLVSEVTKAGLILKYAGKPRPSLEKPQLVEPQLPHTSADLQCSPANGNCEFSIEGPGIIRSLAFRGDIPPDLNLDIYWDDDVDPSVRAPFQYFFGGFVNAAMEVGLGQLTCYFPMPFRRKARVVLRSSSGHLANIFVDYTLERKSVSTEVPYFHAVYNEAQKTLGYQQYSVLQIHGNGLFVGVNLFDSGHNHGGGDAALIDAATTHPRVLHGICGEDYFALAWHHTGTMTPLSGAPVHERRYRLHLENPYPFSESFQFLFGAFAGLTPKSVAFWYQFPAVPRQAPWIGIDAPWKVLGPLGPDTPLPNTVSGGSYESMVTINKPTTLIEHWQDAQMFSGFLDLTYQFRHYVLVESGSGFVAGASRTMLATRIYSPSTRAVEAILGHDDGVLVKMNGRTLLTLPGHSGFGPSRVYLPLHAGWNTLDLVLSNTNNVDWCWSGLSLALRHGIGQDEGLRFSSEPSSNSFALVNATQH